ncbi:MAG: methionine biosynthesis protein MetW [Leptospiraceae bacterium]|nr:methionine biosynthesis protein MetW [Leptospiraceae bacterium]MDW7975811.1 methionine biosynthesis protein MetW [Leptospiraceae bacterium]
MLYESLYKRVKEWIPEKSKVLDLGTGDGTFLKELIVEKNVIGEGVEINPEYVSLCIQKGLVVHQGDIMDGLDQYDDLSFDFILLLGTIQELKDPNKILDEVFRVGKNLIIAYSNFAHWFIRYQLMFLGRTPITPSMPLPWYKTPNIHSFSIKDFHDFCQERKFKIIKEAFFDKHGEVRWFPNLFAEQAIALIVKN